MTRVSAYAAPEPGGILAPFDYDLGPLAPDEVDIAVAHCGICHSDLSMIDNNWRSSRYPLVPGHEVIGRIARAGSGVRHLAEGDLVGLGWHAGYCLTCAECLGGHHHTCAQAQPTIRGRHGGFADLVRAQAASVLRLPDGLDPASAGPLLCGGITVFHPIDAHVRPTDRVAVVGIGGLGHLALQFLRAWGCEVTAFTTTPQKADEARRLGAHDVLDTRDPKALNAARGRFNMILSTVNVPLDWNRYASALAPRGRLHLAGVVMDPLSVAPGHLQGNERSIGASPVGAPATMARMLDFAARHRIRPVTEHFPLAEVNTALDHLRAGKTRYRVVLDL